MVKEALIDILVDKYSCDKEELNDDTKFLDIGLDSLDVVELMVDIEDVVDKEIELDERVETIGELVNYIEERL